MGISSSALIVVASVVIVLGGVIALLLGLLFTTDSHSTWKARFGGVLAIALAIGLIVLASQMLRLGCALQEMGW